MRHLKEGLGWRLGYDPDASVFKGLVGGDRWTVELTEAEFADFCRLTLQLADTVRSLANELMDEERICCEQETAHIWLEVEGLPTAFDLRFILLAGRRAEGGWTATATANIIQAIPALTLF
ncbi:DUF1818 family protein [Leptolyngbya iicbica]|uniref:DUF1818 family protein n=2 Tax=Cyanophyceae TaxID=3028117 RepID=A0A4Q7EEE5_9CYAN|nr:DUF1818 family protein [Leptolyngbya sp. LK]RZM79635.1 DUF1818 family protein [Leptolyngbya sp. LK]